MNPSDSIKGRVLAFLENQRAFWGDEAYYSVNQIAEPLGVSKSSVRRAIQLLGDRLDKYQVEPGLEEAGFYGPGRPPMVYAIKEDENEDNC